MSVQVLHPRPAAPLRLTRRGRLLLIGLPAMLIVGALLTVIGFFTTPAMASAGSGLNAPAGQKVTVSGGETLWSLAVELAPERDPRDVVAEIVELNNLTSSVVQAGEQLFVPIAP